jgi:hypothetical protein
MLEAKGLEVLISRVDSGTASAWHVYVVKPPKGFRAPDVVVGEFRGYHERLVRVVDADEDDIPSTYGLNDHYKPVRLSGRGEVVSTNWERLSSVTPDYVGPEELRVLAFEAAPPDVIFGEGAKWGIETGLDLFNIFSAHRPGSCMSECYDLINIYAENPDVVQVVWYSGGPMHEGSCSALVWFIDGYAYLDRTYSDYDTDLSERHLIEVVERELGVPVHECIYDGCDSLFVTLKRPLENRRCDQSEGDYLPYTDSLRWVTYWDCETVTLSSEPVGGAIACDSTRGTRVLPHQCEGCGEGYCGDECPHCNVTCLVTGVRGPVDEYQTVSVWDYEDRSFRECHYLDDPEVHRKFHADHYLVPGRSSGYEYLYTSVKDKKWTVLGRLYCSYNKYSGQVVPLGGGRYEWFDSRDIHEVYTTRGGYQYALKGAAALQAVLCDQGVGTFPPLG